MEQRVFNYIYIIRKYLKLILLITLSVFVVSAIYTYKFQPSLYKSHVMFELGSIASGNNNDFLLFPPADIVKKINDGDYNYRIARKVGPLIYDINWKAVSLKDSSIVRVYIYTKNKSIGLQVLNELIDAVRHDVEEKMNVWKEMIKVKIISMENSISELEFQRNRLDKTISEYGKIYSSHDSIINTHKLKNDKSVDQAANKSRDIDKLLYNLTVQQTLTSRAELLMITNNIMKKRQNVSLLKKQIALAKEVEVIGDVVVDEISEKPNRPAIIASCTLLAFVCSLFFVLFNEVQRKGRSQEEV